MERDQNNFVPDFKEGNINVQRHSIGGQTLFKVSFYDIRRPLVVTRALHPNAYRFWTSISEGRQRQILALLTLCVGVDFSFYKQTGHSRANHPPHDNS
jgi:hypothetical protein